MGNSVLTFFSKLRYPYCRSEKKIWRKSSSEGILSLRLPIKSCDTTKTTSLALRTLQRRKAILEEEMMANLFLGLVLVGIVAGESKVGKVLSKASKRENYDIDLSPITDRITALETAMKKASRMCQTGTVKCESDCGGKDPDGGEIFANKKKVAVEFSPKFVEAPTVNMATSQLFMTAGGESDKWGFYQEVEDLSTTGFTAVLVQEDIAISWHSALWIACGKVKL